MALQTSGAISLNDIHIEAGGTTGTQVSVNDEDVRDLIDKSSSGQMAFNEWYGATKFDAEMFIDNIGNSTYRNYLETKARSNAKRSYTGTGFFNEGDPSVYRYSTSISISVAWGSIPANWSGARGSTILYYNYGHNTHSSTYNLTGTSIISGGVERSFSVTEYESTPFNELSIGYYSNDSTDYNLDGSTIKGTFKKNSKNLDNCQTIIALPGKWDRVDSGLQSYSSAATVSAQANDVVILFSGGGDDAYRQHTYLSTNNLTRRGGQRVTRWYDNHNLSLWTVDSGATSFSIRGATSQDDANVAWFQLRYSG